MLDPLASITCERIGTWLQVGSQYVEPLSDARTPLDGLFPHPVRRGRSLKEEFGLLDEILKVRAEAGLTQTELAPRIGTTQSAVARLETSMGKHSPSIGTLRRYASALGYRLQIRLVKNQSPIVRKQVTCTVPDDANVLLAKARAVRRTPKGVQLTDRLLHSLKGQRHVRVSKKSV